MPRKNLLFCQRSMKKPPSSFGRSNGAPSLRGSSLLFYGLLLCISVSNYAEAAYTAPSNCTSVTWIYNGNKVQNISCANQQLISVPKDGKEGSDVFKFDLSENQISSLANDVFQYFTNLQNLDLSYNQIQSVTVDTFSNLTNLKSLNLAGNDISTLPEEAFHASLVTLNLSRNANFIFDTKMRALYHVLDLSYTNLASLTKEHLKNLVNLQELYLSHNNLTLLDSRLFKELSSLEVVDISWNKLTNLDSLQVFKQDSGLRTLDLSHNSISYVHKDFLNDADTVTNIDLSNNRISSLESDVFNDVRALESIDLSYNDLTSIPDDIFKDVPVITTIYLNNNQLSSVSDKLFKDNPNLENLYLSANSLSTIPTTLWQSQTTLKIDLSSNTFICDCTVRDYLFEAYYDSNKEIKNIDSTTCTDSTLNQHTYLDFNDPSCSGNLGSACFFTTDCKVRNSKCDASQCVCSANFYDTNGDTTDGGLCRDKVSLDYPCPGMDTACAGNNVECTVKSPSSSDTYCLCKALYYDDNPQYLDGSCLPKVELGEACESTKDMCRPDFSECGSGSVCVCQSSHYDNNGPTVAEGECLEKLPLNSSCNETYQCAPSNAECSGNRCLCSAGYYDFTNLGQCQDTLIEVIAVRKKRSANLTQDILEGPSDFYSCSPKNTSSLEISFSLVKVVTSETECKRHCFEKDERYYHLEGSNICLCGSRSISQSCCPLVMSSCSKRAYLGPSTVLAEAGINITHIARPTAGISQSFVMTTSLDAIDQLKVGFGDSMTETIVNVSSATFQHTYLHSGLFWLSASACAASFGVCETVSIPIKVQVPPENVTTYLTGVGDADVSSDLSASFTATFKMGYDIDYMWSRNFNGVVTKKMGCAAGLTQHRHSCIKLETTPATFASAKTACSASGSLLKIDFMVELSEIVTALSASSETFYVGAERVGGVWQWVDGTKTVFQDDDLLDSTIGDCLVLDGSSATLTSTSCTTSATYVCMSEPVSCPKGGELMSSGYCYILASTSSSWTDANNYCMNNFGGWLANVTDTDTNNKVTSLLTTGGVSEAWISPHQVGGVYITGDNSVFNFLDPAFTPNVQSFDEDCFVAMDTGLWTSRDCSDIRRFVCQYSENIQRVTVQSYVLGSADIGMTPGQDLNHVIPTGSLSPTTTDILLFPGLPFSRSGNIQEWIFCSVDAVSGSHDMAFLIWRPSCSVGTIFQAGCIPTEFASCSAGTHTCTSSTTCSDTEKFCYLSSSCKSMNESCTCNSETSSTTGCGTYGTVPTYEVISQTKTTITETGQKCYKVSDGDTSIQEGDIIGLQFPTGDNFVRCENRPSSLDQQTAYSASASDWFVKTDHFPSGYITVEKTCDLQVIYTQDTVQNLPENLGYTSEVGSYQLAISLVETESKQLSVSLEETIDDLSWVYPVLSVPSSSSDSFGTVYTELNEVYDFTFAAGRGTSLMSTFSLVPSQTVSFTNSCVSAVPAAVGTNCNSTMYWSDKPFASFSYSTASVGTATAKIKVTNSLGFMEKSLTIRTEERIAGVSFSLTTTSLINNNVAVNSPVQFDLSVTSGTGLDYSYTVGGAAASSTTSSLTYTFPAIGTFVVQGTVQNILSTETKSITVYAKKAANFAYCQYVDTPYVAAVGLSLNLKLQCDVTTGSEVSTVWMLSDRTSNITSAVSTASTTPLVWTQSVTFSSVSTVTVTTFAQDPFEAVSVNGTVDVYNQVPSVSLVANVTDVFPNQTVQLTASVPSTPGSYGTVEFSFDFGEGTTITSSLSIVTHTFTTGGNYTVEVTASNGPSSVTDSVSIVVYEEVSGVKLTYNGPKEKSNPVTFTASVTTGNFLSYHFVSSPAAFDVTQSSSTYTHTFVSADDYNVTVTASNSLSQQSYSVTAYVMDATDLKITNFKMDGNDVSDCVETKIGRNFSVAVIHYSVATVSCDWDFGDGTVFPSTSCSKTYAYSSAGNFTVTVTAKYTPQNVKKNITQLVCFHERISSPSIALATPIALPSTGKVSKDVTVAVATGDPLTYSWSTNATGGSSTGPVFQIEFSSEGTYFVSVTVSNEINSLSVTKQVTVIEEISGLAILCSTCNQKSGEFYIRSNTAYTFSVSTTTGTGMTFSWDFGDSATGFGDTNIHTYTAIGTVNLTVTGSSAVTSSEVVFVTVHIETDILAVSVRNYLWNWTTNVQDSDKTLDITKYGDFEVTVSPTGMDELEYVWTYDTGSVEEITTTNLGKHLYTTTGQKSCTVTVRNSLHNMTSSPFTFYVIEKFVTTSINVTENGKSLNGTSESVTYKVALNHQSTFTASSHQIVPGTVEYFSRLKMKSTVTNSYILQSSTGTDKTDPTLTFNFTQEAVYSLEVTITNSLGIATVTVYIEAIPAISGPFINAPAGADGNITLGASLVLTGGVTVGGYLSYNWFYAEAPTGQSLSSATASSVTLTPGEVGIYIVTLEVSNPVSSALRVNYTINVMVGVSGVTIDVTLPYTDAVKVGTSLTFNAAVSSGTELSYSWDVGLAGVSQSTGSAKTFGYTFNTQGLYNITLSVENYASSESAFKEIYSLNDVPAFNLQTSGATFNSGINKYVAETNALVNFLSDITTTTFIQFDWKVNGTSEVTTETFQKSFTSPADYLVQLFASNLVSSENSGITILVQDPLVGFSIQNCNGTYLMDTIITLTASYTSGTDIAIVWTREQFSDATSTATTVQYSTVGTFSVNVTGSNYVSQDTKYCWINTQGKVSDLKLAVSEYKFVNYSVTFTVTGNYLSPATFTWSFSHGVTRITSTPTLDLDFAAKGSYTLEVTVANDVSSSKVNATFDVEELACSKPTLKVVGNSIRQVRRARAVELSVDVSTNGCTDYTSVNSWKIYTASSCSGSLTNEYVLPSSIKTNTPNLQLTSNSLDYGTYCVVFSHTYENTPVQQFRSITLTVVESPLTAVLIRGHKCGASEGTTLTVDASASYDPDEVAGTTFIYTWSCTQTVGTAEAANVCAQVSALTAPSSTLTGLTLNSGEIYVVNVTVSASGRTSGSMSQTITIQSATTPVVSMKCTTCEAYGHTFLTSSRSLSLEGSCISGCTSSVAFKWTVTDTATNTPLVIDNSQTSTDTDQLNFVLKHSNLQSDKAYTFTFEATVGSETGSAQITLQPSSKPSAGNCSITPSTDIIPLYTKLKYSCTNIVDSDTLSGIYYKVVIKPTTVYRKSIIAYYGPKEENEIYVVPFSGTSYDTVEVEVKAINDYGAENTGFQRTISFKAPTLLSTQTNEIDYIVDQMISVMGTVAKLNNPSILRQFLLSTLDYLNDQSSNSVGTPAQRKAIRDVIINSLSGLPMSTVYDIQQTASALEYLVEYTDEISLDTITKALNEIDAMRSQWESMGIPRGADGRDYDSETAMLVNANIQQALKALSSVESDSAVLAKFGNLSAYTLEVSSSSLTTTSSSEETQTQALIVQCLKYTKELLIVMLKTMVPNEDVVQVSSADYSYEAKHVHTHQITESFSTNLGVLLLIPDDVLSSHTSFNEDSAFQLMIVDKTNQLNFGNSGSSNLNIGTSTVALSFHDTDGNSVLMTNLADEVIMYMFKDSVTPYTINETGLQYSSDYDPLSNMNYSSRSIDPGKTWGITLNVLYETGVAYHCQVRANFTSSTDRLHASLYKNSIKYTSSSSYVNARPLTITKEMMDNPQHDHLDYTFFIPPDEVEQDDVFQVQITVTQTAEVLIAEYYSKCEYFKETEARWDSTGCTPHAESISGVIKCGCTHLTSFGGSLFVSPDELDFTDLSRIDIASNPVAIITCSVIIGLYIVLVIAFRRMDLMDLKRISLIPLCGKDGSFKYEVTIVTGRLPGAGTTAHVGIRLFGEYGKSARQHVMKGGAFQRNCSDTFIIAYDVNLGDLQKLHIWHDNSGLSPSWYLSHVIVNDLQTDNKYYFFGDTWLSLEKENGSIQKEIKAAGANEMSQFGHRLKTAMFNSLADKHLWLSLFNRPAQSRFTRVQRVTCCVTILFTFVVVNAMWYGLLKKDNTELGFEGFGWEEVILALVSNIMVLPVSVGLVFLFKKSRSKPNFLDHVQKPQTAQTLEIENLCGNSQGGSFESTNTGAIPYDLERESTIDSVPPTAALGLRRSRHVAKTHRENTDDSILQQCPAVAMTSASSKSPLWNEDGIMKWPDTVPTFDDGTDSRPSTGSTMASAPAVRQPPAKAGGSTPGAARKSKTVQRGDAGDLLEELDKLENDLKESESRSVKPSGSKKSVSLRKPTMHKSQWGSLEDILQSDDESIADSSVKMKKRGSTTSQSTTRKFNPREDPRINGNGRMWPKSRESVMSRESSTSQTGGVTAGLRPGYYSEMTMESRDIKIPVHKEGCTLPPWCIYIAYIICFLLSVFSIIIVILYCFTFGSEESLKWVLALILSLILSFFVIEPLKAMLIAVYVVAMFKNVEIDEDDDFIDIEPTFDNSNEKLKDVKFKPISGFALLQAKEEGRKIHRMNIMIRQFIAYLFYLWLIMVIVYVHFQFNTYLMTKHVENDFIAPTTTNHRQFTNITSIDEFWEWTETVFVDSLYKHNLTEDEEHGFLLGEARARLIRGITTKCEAASAASGLGASSLTDRTCHGQGNYDEDTDDYAEGWNHSNSNFSWRHYTAGELGSTHKIGHVATYGGGGYPQGLGTSQAETDSIIAHLKDKGWIDLQTRAIIFEFALYSAGSDITSLVALLAEFPLTGGVITSYEIQSQKLLWFQERTVDPLMVLECILFLVVVYSVVHLALQIRELGKQFFKALWNWYEMLTTLMALVSIGMYMGCVIEATNTFNRFLDNQTGFTNFERAVYVHVGMRYLHAWLLFLLMFKVVKQLRFIKFMYVYEKTLSKAVGHLLGTGLIYVILLLVYAQVGYLMYGQIVSGFESVGHTITTLVVMIRGSFDFWPMLDYHPIFSHFYVYSYYAFAYGILIGLVISILTSTYKVMKSQMYYKATLEMQDYEMIDFMLKRFKLWAGIQKPKPAFRRVRFPGLPSVSSRSSSSYSNRSASSLHSAQSITGPQFSEVQLRSMMTRMAPTWQAVLRRMDKIVALDDEEESLVKRAEDEMKNLNWKCRMNELERQHKEILSWKSQPSTSGKPPVDTKQRQSILKRSGATKDNQDRKAPATVSGALSRTAASTPDVDKGSQGRRPLSDQGVRVEQPSTSKRHSSSTEKSKIQTFFKSIKPSKPAWNK